MADLKWEMPALDEIELDGEALAALDRGIDDVENGRYVSLEVARRRIPVWIATFASPRPR